MYILQNAVTKEFFCEFHEHLVEDTRNIEEAADFDNIIDAYKIAFILNGNYKAEPKWKFINQ